MTHTTLLRVCKLLPVVLATAGGTVHAADNFSSIQRDAEQLQRDIKRQGERIERLGADIDRTLNGHIARVNEILDKTRPNNKALEGTRKHLEKIGGGQTHGAQELARMRQASDEAEAAFQANIARIKQDPSQTEAGRNRAVADLAAARERRYADYRMRSDAARAQAATELKTANEYKTFVQSNDKASRKGIRRSIERTQDGAVTQDARTYRSDYTRLQGAGLMLSESMLGTMDDRLGADIAATEKRGWVRVGLSNEGGGGATRSGAGFYNNGTRYHTGSFQLGADLYRTASERAGVFISGGNSSFGNASRARGRLLEKPNVSGVGIGGYYNHTDAAGWYVDGAMQVSRLGGEFGQYGERFAFNNDTADYSIVRKNEKVKSSGMGFAAQGEVGYRYAMNQGMSLTPKLRIDHHRVRLSGANGTKELGSTSFDNLGKTGIYYAVRVAHDMEISRGKLNLWAEPGISHAVGAKTKQTHTNYFDKRRLQTERNLNATRVGLRVGIDGELNKQHSLRFEGGLTKGLGRKNSMGNIAMASWAMKF